MPKTLTTRNPIKWNQRQDQLRSKVQHAIDQLNQHIKMKDILFNTKKSDQYTYKLVKSRFIFPSQSSKVTKKLIEKTEDLPTADQLMEKLLDLEVPPDNSNAPAAADYSQIKFVNVDQNQIENQQLYQ